MIAVLGLGSIGMRHARNALALGERVIGFDPSPDRRALLAAEGGRGAADRDAAIDQAECVVSATPSHLHLGDLAACIQAGKPILVEKPLAHTLDGLAEIMDRAEAQAVPVAVAMMLRLHPAVMRAKDILDRGDLGKPLWARFLAALYLPDWRPGQDWTQGYADDPKSGGALFDYIHEIDLAAHLLGDPVALACVAGNSGTLGLRSEDVADVILGHPGGVNSAVHVDYVTRPRRRFGEIAGTKGIMRIDLDGRSLTRWTDAGDMVENTTFPGGYADDYVAELAAFLAACRTGAPVPCSGRNALAVLKSLIQSRTLAGLPQ